MKQDTGTEYYAKVLESMEMKPGSWHYLRVGVFRYTTGEEGEGDQIGEYQRNYPAFYSTFFPFTVEGEAYALYSRDYTSTRLMKLPSCEDIGGENRNAFGFCPVEYFVPTVEYVDPDPENPGRDISRTDFAPFGFVAGCIWGDDSSWKIQLLDLRQVAQGCLKRKMLMGYTELAEGKKLREVISAAESEGDEFYFDMAGITSYAFCWTELDEIEAGEKRRKNYKAGKEEGMIRITTGEGRMRLCDLDQGTTYTQDGGKTVFIRGQVAPCLTITSPHRYYATNLETGEVSIVSTDLEVDVYPCAVMGHKLWRDTLEIISRH